MIIDTSTRSNQVKEHLLGYISNNQMTQGDQLPSEAEMAKAIGVSRNTIREAYITLEAEGIIVRRHGIGTFVARSPMVTDSLVGEALGYFSRIKKAGYNPDVQNLSVTDSPAPTDVCEALGASASEALLCVKRILVANETPAVYLIDYFAPRIKRSDFDWDTFDGDMIALIAESLGINECQMHSRIMAVIPDKETTSLLQLPEGQAILNIRSVITTLSNQPLTYAILYLNPNIIELDATRLIRNK